MEYFLSAILGFLIISSSYNLQLNKTGIVSWIGDGDTFDIDNGKVTIRPADIDAPEINEAGYGDSKAYLIDLLYGKTVYLDVSSKEGVDEYGRLICIVYLDYNSTHYINVNKLIVDSGHAVIKDYSNDFNPYTWRLFVPKTSDVRAVPAYPISSVFVGLCVCLFIYHVAQVKSLKSDDKCAQNMRFNEAG